MIRQLNLINSHMDSSTLQLSIVLTLLFLLFYLLISAFTSQRKLPLHRTSIAIIIGIVAGIVLSKAAPKTFNTLVLFL